MPIAKIALTVVFPGLYSLLIHTSKSCTSSLINFILLMSLVSHTFQVLQSLPFYPQISNLNMVTTSFSNYLAQLVLTASIYPVPPIKRNYSTNLFTHLVVLWCYFTHPLIHVLSAMLNSFNVDGHLRLCPQTKVRQARKLFMNQSVVA